MDRGSWRRRGRCRQHARRVCSPEFAADTAASTADIRVHHEQDVFRRSDVSVSSFLPSRVASDKIRLLLLFVAEKATLADDLRHLWWHHFIPALVAAGDALEHVTRKDRQIFRVEIIELHEAAAAYQVIIERLQLGFHLQRMNGL